MEGGPAPPHRHMEVQTMIIARHLYYPLAGRSAEVLKQRQLACDVRERIGLPRGRILTKARGADALAEVIWEWDYPDVATYDREMEAQNASDEFMAVRPGTCVR